MKMDLFKRKKKPDSEKSLLDREVDDSYEVHEGDDIPVLEKRIKGRKIVRK